MQVAVDNRTSSVVLQVLESGTLALVGFSAMDQVAEVAAAANGARLAGWDLESLEALYASNFFRHAASTAGTERSQAC